MFLCYIDESGTSDIPGNTSHYVLAGLAIPIDKWSICEGEIFEIKKKYDLGNAEIHTGWILRKYVEQNKITDFDSLDRTQRRFEVEKIRNSELLRLQKIKNRSLYKQTKKNFRQTNSYIHLSYNEREQFIIEIATAISQWSYARLFAECVDKIHFNPTRSKNTIDEQAFEQITSRFEHYLEIISKKNQPKIYGLLIHDNNQTVAKRHTELMKKYHRQGTFWTEINNIIETPLFVDSELTSMIQLADICSYSLRRYLENNEKTLFSLIYNRADKKDGVCVGVRHFTRYNCPCMICQSHKKNDL